jgi:Domain of unknown function (DUF6457)
VSADLSEDAVVWITRFAESLGQRVPTRAEIETLLSLAGTAAHASHRQAAPVACWLASQAGLTPAEGLAAAQTLKQSPAE